MMQRLKLLLGLGAIWLVARGALDLPGPWRSKFLYLLPSAQWCLVIAFAVAVPIGLGLLMVGSNDNRERRLGTLLVTLICLAWATDSRLAGTTYYAAPGGGTSASCANNGANVGTLMRCVSVAADQDLIVLTIGNYPGSELGASGYVLMSAKLLSLDCVIDSQCFLRPSVNTAGIRVTGLTGTPTATWDGIVVDGVGGTAPNYCFWLQDSSAGAYNLTISDSECRDPVFYATNFDGGEINLTLTNDVLTASSAVGARSLVYMGTAWTTGSLKVSGGTGTIARHTNAGSCMINAIAASGTPTAEVDGFTSSITIDPTLTGLGEHCGIQILNIANALIKNSRSDVYGTPGSRSAALFRIASNAAMSSANGQILNVVGTNATNGGYGAIIGQDASGVMDNQANNGTIADANITCPSPGNTAHALMLGFNQGGIITRFESTGCGIGVISKDQTVTPGVISGGIITNSGQQYVRVKGSQATVANLLLVAKSGTATLVRVDEDGVTNSSNTNVKNVITYVNGAAPDYTVIVPGANAAAFDRNDWFAVQGAISTNGWSYQGVSHSTLSAWNANAAVGTDSSVDPQFVGGMTPESKFGYRLKPTSPLRRSGVCYLTTGCVHRGLDGKRGFVPPNAGPFQD